MRDRRPSVGAIMVAAGQSRRMGTSNKLLLDFQGQPMVRHCAMQILASAVKELVIVVGFQAEDIISAVQGLPVRIAVNRSFCAGQASSVNRGLAELGGEHSAVLIALADMPLVTTADHNRLITEFQTQKKYAVMVPFHGTTRGNPVIFSEDLRQPILAQGEGKSCRAYFDKHPESVLVWRATSDHFIRDIDTPADYQSANRSD